METIYITKGNLEQSVEWLKCQGYNGPEISGRQLHLPR